MAYMAMGSTLKILAGVWVQRGFEVAQGWQFVWEGSGDEPNPNGPRV